MPQFTGYPALQARGLDISGVLQRADDRKSRGITNALRQAQLKEVQGKQGRRDEAQARIKAKEDLEKVRFVLNVVESMPVERRERGLKEAVRLIEAEGIDVSKAPQSYGNGDQVRMMMAMAGQEAQKLDAPTTAGGMQWNPATQAFEPIPGYVEQQGKLAEAKRAPGGGDAPAPVELANAYKAAHKKIGKKISDVEALNWARQSTTNTPDRTWTTIYAANRRDYVKDKEAREVANEITNFLHGTDYGGKEAVPEPKTKTVGGKAWWEYLPFLGDSGAAGANALASGPQPAAVAPAVTGPPLASVAPLGPGPQAPVPVAPAAAAAPTKSVPQMTLAELKALVAERGKDLSPAELKKIDARMRELGIN